MKLLLLVSFVWAASFGIIKTRLLGVHPDVVNAARLCLAALVFLPFLRRLPRARALELALVGALQFGVMYALYTRSYAALAAHQVALATVMTPVYVTLFDDLLARRLRLGFLACAALAAAGTAVSVGVGRAGGAPLSGVVLVQLANLCFAVGQIWYRRALMRAPGLRDREAFAWCAAGAACVALLLAAPRVAGWGSGSGAGAGPAAQAWATLGPAQLLALLYLGVVASGLCFFLWNVGARKVNTGVLAVMNDLKIPLGVLVSLALFGERAAWPRLAAGGAMIGLAWALAARAPAGPVRDADRGPSGGRPSASGAR